MASKKQASEWKINGPFIVQEGNKKFTETNEKKHKIPKCMAKSKNIMREVIHNNNLYKKAETYIK